MRKLFFTILGVVIAINSAAQSARCYDLNKVLQVEPTPIYKQHLDASKDLISIFWKTQKHPQIH